MDDHLPVVVLSRGDLDDLTAAAEARGHARAVAQLRDEEAYWEFAHEHMRAKTQRHTAASVAAAYLEAQGATP